MPPVVAPAIGPFGHAVTTNLYDAKRYSPWDVVERATASDGENDEDDYYCYSFGNNNNNGAACEALDLTLKKKPSGEDPATPSSGVSSTNTAAGSSGPSSAASVASPPHILKFRLLQAVRSDEDEHENGGEDSGQASKHEGETKAENKSEDEDEYKVHSVRQLCFVFKKGQNVWYSSFHRKSP
jgi:hypothetical protein